MWLPLKCESADFSLHARHFVQQHSAKAPCILCSIFCCTHDSLYLGTLQRHPAPSAGSIAAPSAPAPWNRRVTAVEFIKISKWEYNYCCTYGARRSASRHSAMAPCTLCRVHLCTFYHVYRPRESQFSPFFHQNYDLHRIGPMCTIHITYVCVRFPGSKLIARFSWKTC